MPPSARARARCRDCRWTGQARKARARSAGPLESRRHSRTPAHPIPRSRRTACPSCAAPRLKIPVREPARAAGAPGIVRNPIEEGVRLIEVARSFQIAVHQEFRLAAYLAVIRAGRWIGIVAAQIDGLAEPVRSLDRQPP